MQYAFCDEFGAFGFDFDKENVSTHFLIAAIIINEEDISAVRSGAEEIRRRYFQTGEMKSSKVANNHKRRRLILEKLKELPFNIYLFVADKRKIYENSGLRFKKPFYMFLNQYVYRDLHDSFQQLTIVSDETGRDEFMSNFADYVRTKNPDVTLFDEFNFKFDNSEHGILIQVADIICGSLAYSFDEKKKAKSGGMNYVSFLGRKILHIEEFPKDYNTFSVADRMQNECETDQLIANICYRKALAFKQHYDNTEADENVRMQIVVLNYLLFRFMNNSIRTYIPTKELIGCLERHGFERMSMQVFRNMVIAKLRDRGVIISSSTKGYKIPSKMKEVEDFIAHGKGIIEPMVSRLRLCYDAINLGSNGSIRILDAPEFNNLKRIINVDN